MASLKIGFIFSTPFNLALSLAYYKETAYVLDPLILQDFSYLIWRPTASRLLNFDPSFIQTLKPSVCCRLIPNLAPDPLLNIQSRLMRGQIFQMQPPMGSNKEIDFLARMPSGSVYVEMNRLASKASVEIPQAFNESLPVALRRADHPSSPQQRSHPSKQVEPPGMWTGGRSPQSLSNLRSTKPQALVQSKASFVLKDYGLARSKRSQFFWSAAKSLRLFTS
ncbi:MAG: hypothetical protein H6Q48_2300 [Deltaproteobacteria bacterium]|nr:hypothetical protein [Deltaproteobacteria bacterium]